MGWWAPRLLRAGHAGGRRGAGDAHRHAAPRLARLPRLQEVPGRLLGDELLLGWGGGHLDFYGQGMRAAAVEPATLIDTPLPGWPGCPDCKKFPAASWEMNYYSDGVVGGNIRLEIDETALVVWSFVNHVGYLAEPERSSYMARVWPTVRRATDFLAGWRDPTGLVW